MPDAVKVGFVPFSSAPRGILVVFCDDTLKFGSTTGKALGAAAGMIKRAALARALAIDPAVLLPDFPEQMVELVARIKATPRQPGVDEIRIPSERAFREREQRRIEGIVLDRKVVEALNAL